jgi:hypothetical protein
MHITKRKHFQRIAQKTHHYRPFIREIPDTLNEPNDHFVVEHSVRVSRRVTEELTAEADRSPRPDPRFGWKDILKESATFQAL